MRASIAVLLLALGSWLPAWAADSGPLPGEVVVNVAEFPPEPADARRVPGFAGAWRPAGEQEQVGVRIATLEARRDPPCRDVRVIDTLQLAPDLMETRPRRVRHSLEQWTVLACGKARRYEVWYRFEPDGTRLAVAENAAGDFQALLDPPYRRLRELAAARRDEVAGGRVRWLNLPVPPRYQAVARDRSPQGWSVDYVPAGESAREWTQLLAVQAMPAAKVSGRFLLNGMQQARAARCGGEAGPVEPQAALEGAAFQTFLVCPEVPGTNFAELAVVKAIEGPDFVYLIQRAWRLPAASREQVLADSGVARAAAEALLAQVRLCDPAGDHRDCFSPFPR